MDHCSSVAVNGWNLIHGSGSINFLRLPCANLWGDPWAMLFAGSQGENSCGPGGPCKTGAGEATVRASTGKALSGGPPAGGQVGLAGVRCLVSGNRRTGTSATSNLTCRAPTGSAGTVGLWTVYWTGATLRVLDTVPLCTIGWYGSMAVIGCCWSWGNERKGVGGASGTNVDVLCSNGVASRFLFPPNALSPCRQASASSAKKPATAFVIFLTMSRRFPGDTRAGSWA